MIRVRLEEIRKGKSANEEEEDYFERMYKAIEKQDLAEDELLKDLFDEFSLLFAAGTDTTSNSSIMMLYYCSKNLAAMNRLVE